MFQPFRRLGDLGDRTGGGLNISASFRMPPVPVANR